MKTLDELREFYQTELIKDLCQRKRDLSQIRREMRQSKRDLP